MTLDQLRKALEHRFEHAVRRGYVTAQDVDAALGDAREYAAAQVEAHARPGPWPPRGPDRRQHPQGHNPRREEAS